MSEESKKILILRFGALGDIVHTTIIAQAIKNKYPNCEIHYCCEARYVEVLQNNPDIDKVISYDHKRRKDFSYNLDTALRFRHEHYDVIFNLTNAFRNNFITFVASPKMKVTKQPMGNRHVVDAFFRAAKIAFPQIKQPKNLRLGLDEKVQKDMETRLSQYSRPFIVFSPGGETDKNRQGRTWPAQHWVELGQMLGSIYGGTIFISGSPDEKAYHKTISDKITGSVLFSGTLPISHSMCLIALSDLFISGDSGPLHIASALCKNVIGIYGSTNPENVRPYGERGYCAEPMIDCRYCWQKECQYLEPGQKHTPCISSIRPEHILHLINSKKIFASSFETS